MTQALRIIMTRTRSTTAFSVIALATLISSSACAQDFPVKPVRLVVPVSAGEPPDMLARILLPDMTKFLGQTIVVENRPGADQRIALEYVAKQVPADGYTIVQVIVPSLAIMPVLVKDLRFDPVKDLPPFIGYVEGRNVLATSMQTPWKTFEEIVAYAKSNPGKLNYGGPSPFTRISVEGVVRSMGLNAVFVPYGDPRFYTPALFSNEIQMGILTVGIMLTSGKDKVRALAMTGQRRHPLFPDVPTFAELGLPQLRGSSYSLNAPAGVPKGAIDKLFAAASHALQQPDVRDRFTKLQYEIVEQGPDAAARSLAEVAKYYAEIAAKAGIRAE